METANLSKTLVKLPVGKYLENQIFKSVACEKQGPDYSFS
jgi:hypothetical protein